MSLGAVVLDRGGRRVWWSEGRPAEGGRVAVLRRDADGRTEDLAPGLSARTRAHEYGGAWVPVGDGDGVVLSSASGQRLWLVAAPGAEPVALTPDSGGHSRYADAAVVGDAVVCVREDVGGGTGGEDVRRALVRVLPLTQAGAFAEALRREHLPHALVVVEGEQHGFRRAESVTQALEVELSFCGQVWGFDPPGVPLLPLEH